jgi:hypothetical protein
MGGCMSFLVLGLPRSRTAWLANFLTYGDLFCYHEGIDGCTSLEEYKEKIEGKGDSNTGLMLFDFEEHFPNAKIIIIDSDVDKAIEFGRDVFNVNIEFEMAIAKNRLDKMEGLHIKLEDINSRLGEIWEYVSDEPFDQERADMLVKLDVQMRNPLDIDFDSINQFKGTVNACHTLQ